MAQSLQAFTPIKFSLKLNDIMRSETIYNKIANTNYEGELKKAGDTVRVRTAAKITLSDYTKNMTLVSQELNPIFEDMVITQQKYFKFSVDDIDKMQNDINTIETYVMEAKRDIIEHVDKDILSYAVKNVNASNMLGVSYSTGTVAVATTTGVVTGTGTTFTADMVGGIFKANGMAKSYLVTAFTSATSITIRDLDNNAVYTGGAVAGGTSYIIGGASAITLTKDNVYQYIVSLRTALSKENAPMDGRFIVANADFEGVLLQAPQFIPAVQTAYDKVVIEGLLGKIAGFEIYRSELVAGNNTTGFFFLAGRKEFMSLAMQINEVSVIPSASSESTFTSTCKGLLVYGRKVFEGTRLHGAVLRAKFA